MAEFTKTFSFSIDDKVTVLETERAGWIKGIYVRPDGQTDYNVATTKASGEPENRWFGDTAIALFIEE